MNAADFSSYIKNRYEEQIKWYSVHSSTNKRFYNVFQWGVIVLSACIPVLIGFLPEEIKWISIILSIILGIGTTALKTFKFQEIWVNYRTISETLKKEKHFYDAGLDAYKGAQDKEATFVDRVESLISRENSLWVTTHLQKKDDKHRKKET
ncbi:MAG TPA: DUF4231 domain-containing protein [Chitinivibrionales bacterium]|nr:DUF4231 domain-containing protein [Chitinivibrionales bacterium]